MDDPAPHFYRLILRVEPGGSRRHEEWIAGTLAELAEILGRDLESSWGAYHAICYGRQDMHLECWHERRLVARLDVQPCITLDLVDDREQITFEDGFALYDFEADEELPAERQLCQRIFDPGVRIVATIDWSQIPLPALAGPPLRPGELAELHDSETMTYGYHDLSG